MIFEAILNVFKSIVLLLLGLLPDLSLVVPSFDLAPMFDILRSASYFVNLSVVSWCFVTMFTFANLEWLFSVLMWIVRKIPGIK